MKSTQTTHGIEISIHPVYQEQHSNPGGDQYVFAYFVTIKNRGDETVQLLRRHWYILEAGTVMKEVEGKGVVGKTPVIRPGDIYEYQSWVKMRATVGKMYGFYTMQRITDGDLIDVEIPEFALVVPFIKN